MKSNSKVIAAVVVSALSMSLIACGKKVERVTKMGDGIVVTPREPQWELVTA